MSRAKKTRPKKAKPAPFEVTDVTEFTMLGAELANLCRGKYDEIIDALRKIVDAQRTILEFSGPLQQALRPLEWRARAAVRS